MNTLNDKKGLSLIEVIISIIILSILATSFSLLFSISLDTPVIYNKEKAYQYAKMEMEKLNNKAFVDIVSIPRTNYSQDTNYDYEIIVNEINYDLKEVWINFYLNGSNTKISELYTTFFKLEKVKICDDFEINGYVHPPLNWSISPPGQWSVLNIGGIYQNVLAYRRRIIGYAYTNDYIGSNYILSSEVYVQSTTINTSCTNYIGGRCQGNEDGYYIKIYIAYNYLIPSLSYMDLSLVKFVGGLEFPLTGSIRYNGVFTNRWLNFKLEMVGNNLKFYFDGNLVGETVDNVNPFTNGGLRIRASTLRNYLYTYFDNICVEEPWRKVLP